MINVTYYYSACVGISTPDVSVLCDPWFTDGIYDGSWFLYPPVKDPMALVGKHDFIYVSHIHADHYDNRFLKLYLHRYPDTKVIIADFKHNYLSRKMTADGIPHTVNKEFRINDTHLHLLPHGDGINDFDSVLVVCRAGRSVVNWNDNFYNDNLIQQVLDIAPEIDIALVPYTGAGPYPQTYLKDKVALEVESKRQKIKFFARYLAIVEALKPKVRIPFAGKYLLAGRLYNLNEYRGTSDATEIIQIDNKAVVLADGGIGSIDTETFRPTAIRTVPYNKLDMHQYALFHSDKKMDYEVFFEKLDLSCVPFRRLLKTAHTNAMKKSQQITPYIFEIDYGLDNYIMEIGQQEAEDWGTTPRSKITIDPRYLYGLLTGVFHWNNAETGSQFMTERQGGYSRQAQDFLNFFHV